MFKEQSFLVQDSLDLSSFANMDRWRVGLPIYYQSLTLGRPVVIPLLSDYVVGAGFVSSRDFLIGLVPSTPIIFANSFLGNHSGISRAEFRIPFCEMLF
jgi:hypothetical protein